MSWEEPALSGQRMENVRKGRERKTNPYQKVVVAIARHGGHFD
jgi:hypothetical protein